MKTTLTEICAKLSMASKNLWDAYATHDLKKISACTDEYLRCWYEWVKFKKFYCKG